MVNRFSKVMLEKFEDSSYDTRMFERERINRLSEGQPASLTKIEQGFIDAGARAHILFRDDNNGSMGCAKKPEDVPVDGTIITSFDVGDVVSKSEKDGYAYIHTHGPAKVKIYGIKVVKVENRIEDTKKRRFNLKFW